MIKLAYVNTDLDILNAPIHIGDPRINKKEKFNLKDEHIINFAINRKDDTDIRYLYQTDKRNKLTDKLVEVNYFFCPKRYDYFDRYETDGSYHAIILTDKKQINNIISKVFLYNNFMLFDIFNSPNKIDANIDLTLTFYKNVCVIQNSIIKVKADKNKTFKIDLIDKLGLNTILNLKHYYIASQYFLYPLKPGNTRVFAVTDACSDSALVSFFNKIPYTNVNNVFKINELTVGLNNQLKLYKSVNKIPKNGKLQKCYSGLINHVGNITSVWDLIGGDPKANFLFKDED